MISCLLLSTRICSPSPFYPPFFYHWCYNGRSRFVRVEILSRLKPHQTAFVEPTRLSDDPCEHPYDPQFEEDCSGDNWEPRSFFDKAKGDCRRFWFGGCNTASKNLFSDQKHCRDKCAHKMTTSPPSVPVQTKECLDDFDKNLTKSCMLEKQWKNRYYFDKDARVCRMFWTDGCFSTSRNNFPDQETCMWKCEGRHPRPEGRACLESFDTAYLGDCQHGEFQNRFYFDLTKKKCVVFHWGGCRSPSQNMFVDMGQCQELCETPPRQLVQSCLEPFDHGYRDSCTTDGKFHQYYFFDHNTHTCRMFWYGNCKRTGENIYPTLETCQWICERRREERVPSHCQDKFDQKYTESCGNGAWQEKWYFDHNSGSCKSFWFDQCISTSQNIFPDEASCESLCEHPGYEVESRLPDSDSNYRCLEPKEIGDCEETYPAFYYDRRKKKCMPFAYSGCGGNGNRFLTLQQCEGLCYYFNDVTDPEMDCYLPLDAGFGKNDDHCTEHASFRFFFDRDYGSCSQFWYLGCGGNNNNFYSYEVCQRTCRHQRRLPSFPKTSQFGKKQRMVRY